MTGVLAGGCENVPTEHARHALTPVAVWYEPLPQAVQFWPEIMPVPVW